MANICIVVGKTSTGKSSSIRGLNPKETIVINVLGKKLPFKGSNSLYSEEQKNFFRVEEYTDTIRLLESIDKGAAHVRNIVLDDAIFIMSKEFFKRAKETGYGKFTELAQHFQQIISVCEKMRDNINVFFLLHAEELISDKTIVGYKIRTIGKLLDDQYNPMEVVPMALFSDVRFNQQGKPEYGFYTHTTIENGIRIPAKSPDGMFEKDWIPNDLGLVVKAINEYYG
jgi:hypothetical protein|nr:MAG TPA: AAA domain protein [Bacteriophage sp.]